MFTQKSATAVLVKDMNGYRLGDEHDITIGQPIHLLLPNGQIVRTSKVTEWNKYGGFSIKTCNSIYLIATTKIR